MSDKRDGKIKYYLVETVKQQILNDVSVALALMEEPEAELNDSVDWPKVKFRLEWALEVQESIREALNIGGDMNKDQFERVYNDSTKDGQLK